ncbi:MAG: hypothetical protein WA941_09235 [Nitrososphaeraceae archaeon]
MGIWQYDYARGLGSDFLVGERSSDGNDKLYAGPGDDVLIGGPGQDYFDWGDGCDILINFNLSKGDSLADNCEVLLTDLGDKEIMSQGVQIKSKLQASRIGSERHPTNLEDIVPQH